MVFNSFAFLILFSTCCILTAFTALPVIKKLGQERVSLIRHIILLIASYVFYAWWDWRFTFLMLALTATAYFCSILLTESGKKVYLYIAVILPLLVLGFFKYFNFFLDSFALAFGIERMGALNIILPVGISFYTFQSLSYTIDVHRGKILPEKSFIKVALYIAFFPQLVAGPIVKANDFIPQLHEDRNISLDGLEKGLQIFAIGLFKKIVISDNISLFSDTVFGAPGEYHALSLIFAVVAYSIQIYCDFSGYSDMAIGCAKCLGYDLNRNFNLPYIARNVSEFWKRWHISLSTWLMEYLYIPLGGNRRGVKRTYINLFLTMLIGGLWHGASWTFVAWGALHGAALCVHKIWMKLSGHTKNHKGSTIGNIISAVFTYIFVIFCWIFFRSPTFSVAWSIIRGIFIWQGGTLYISTWCVFGIIVLTAATLAAFIKSRREKQPVTGFYPAADLSTVWGLTLFFVFIGITFGLAYTGSNQFIYFQF
ncbi:MAG: MBOAT family protein [Ruminococcaceae bacterium]|nr:MBOAT family protein [Oscillospiraceae bacterium]